MTAQVSWTQMKVAVEEQASSDPQRAKLSERAWQGVEAGLQHLTGVGYNFEIVPRGTWEQLAELKEPSLTKSLSVSDAKVIVSKPPNIQTAKFDAMTKQARTAN